MEISKTTIKVQCSLNYQVASMEAEISNYTEQELTGYTQYLVETCSQTVKNISASVGPTHPQQTQQKPVVQTQVQNQYQAPRTPQPVQNQGFNPQPRQQYQSNQYQVKPVSEAQIKYLKGLGYNGPMPQSWNEANQILQQLKAERGIA